MIYDFRYRNAQGKWKALGHRKGLTRDTAFASLQARDGPNPATEYMSRPRDGRTRSWDVFRRAKEKVDERQPARRRERFYLICNGVLDQRAIANLDRRGLYWKPRSELNPTRDGEQHILTVEAESGEEAVEQVRKALLGVGGEATELRLVGSRAA
ncbi:MAG: hypothetical protein WB507_09240 [Solirubrobacterales bacterium]